jgi:hypothetical protein
MSSSATPEDVINIEPMSIDQFAGSVVLILGAVGSLLLVIWQSRCACKCRIGWSDKCYIFDCSREPPSQEEVKELANERKALGPAGEANLERDKVKKIPPEDRLVPEEIRRGTFPERQVSIEVDEVPVEEEQIVPGVKGGAKS